MGEGGLRLTLAFYRQQVNKGLIRELPSTSPTEDSLVSSTRLGLTLRLERHHFPGGTLTITCQSTLPRIRGDRALERVETATLAASNQRLAQEPPRSGSTIDARPVSISICCLLAILPSFHFCMFNPERIADESFAGSFRHGSYRCLSNHARIKRGAWWKRIKERRISRGNYFRIWIVIILRMIIVIFMRVFLPLRLSDKIKYIHITIQDLSAI